MKEVGDALTYLQQTLIEEIMKHEVIEQNKLYIDVTKIEADANEYTFK